MNGHPTQVLAGTIISVTTKFKYTYSIDMYRKQVEYHLEFVWSIYPCGWRAIIRGVAELETPTVSHISVKLYANINVNLTKGKRNKPQE